MFNKLFDISAQAMSASRQRIDTIASNIANAQTTRTPEGGPYRRRDVVFAATDIPGGQFDTALDKASVAGVRVAAVLADTKEPMKVYDPSHPDADKATGMLSLPNINPVTEMVNLLGASAAYRAATEVASVTREMSQALTRLAQR